MAVAVELEQVHNSPDLAEDLEDGLSHYFLFA